MNLHRSDKKPQWESARSLNGWQRLAKRTHGYATLPNIITSIGILFVVAGVIALLEKQYWTTFVLLVVGRLCDVADGWAAEWTQTKSPFGEAYDATIDKIGTFLTLLVLLITGVGPRWLVVLLAVPHIIIATISVGNWRSGQRMHPSLVGKLSMATVWLSLCGFVLVRAVNQHSGVLYISVRLLAFSSVGLGIVAFKDYLQPKSADASRQ